eukprot:69899_1
MNTLRYLTYQSVIFILINCITYAREYVFITTYSKTAVDAESYCQTNYNAGLATITTTTEYTTALNLITSATTTYVWIGLQRTTDWYWTDGTSCTGDSHYCTPASWWVNTFEDRNCAAMRLSDGKLNDWICNDTDSPAVYQFLCNLPLSNSPTHKPTPKPTNNPTHKPTASPTPSPTTNPTFSPTPTPTNPSPSPTNIPTHTPTDSPTPAPTVNPTAAPIFNPTSTPTTPFPTLNPTLIPTKSPTERPTLIVIAPTYPVDSRENVDVETTSITSNVTQQLEQSTNNHDSTHITIIGIGAACIVLVICLCFMCWNRYRKKKKNVEIGDHYVKMEMHDIYESNVTPTTKGDLDIVDDNVTPNGNELNRIDNKENTRDSIILLSNKTKKLLVNENVVDELNKHYDNSITEGKPNNML